MSYENFYNQIVVIKEKEYGDPADFANDVLTVLGRFRVEQAAQQSVQRTGGLAHRLRGLSPEDWFLPSGLSLPAPAPPLTFTVESATRASAVMNRQSRVACF